MKKKDVSQLTRRTRIAYRYVLLVLIIIALLSILGLVLINLLDPKDFILGKIITVEDLRDLCNNVLGAAIGAAIVDLYLDYRTKDEKDDSINKSIVEALCPPDTGSEPPLVAKLFNHAEFKTFIKNGLSAYAQNSAIGTGCADFFAECCTLLRRHEVYDIDIYPDKIRQSYRHTGVFKRKNKNVDIELRLFLVLGNTKVTRGELDKYLSNVTYAYREEFDEPEFERKIAKKAEEVMAAGSGAREQKIQELFSALSLDLILYKDEQDDLEDGYKIPYKDVTVAVCYNTGHEPFGIHIAGRVPERFVNEERSKDNEYYDGSGYVNFVSQVEIAYPVKKGLQMFPVVYSRIAINPSFTVSFKGFDKIKVKYFPFLSFNNSTNDNHADGRVTESNGSYHFSTARTIFPRSGVVFTWATPVDLESQLKEYGLVDISTVCPEIKVDLKYTTNDNFTGHDVYGDLVKAYFVPEIANMLARVQARLSELRPGHRLLIYDAARPSSIQRFMFDFVKGTPQEKYVANPKLRGFHNYGLAVDLTIVDPKGCPLDMGSGFDDFSQRSNVGREDELVAAGLISPEARVNRAFLSGLMTDEGFEANPDEWWHYQKYTLQEAEKYFKFLDF